MSTTGTTPGGTTSPLIGAAMLAPQVLAANRGFCGPILIPPRGVNMADIEMQIVDPIEFLKQEAVLREEDGDIAVMHNEFRTITLRQKEYALEGRIDRRSRARHGRFIPIRRKKAQILAEASLRTFEKRCAALLEDTTKYAAQFSNVTTSWTNAANATPIADILTRKHNIADRTGIMPNTLRLTRKAFDFLRNTDDIKNAVNADGAGSESDISKISEAKLAEVLDLGPTGRVVVSGSYKQGTLTKAEPIWSDNLAQLGYFPSDPDNEEYAAFVAAFWSETGAPWLRDIREFNTESIGKPYSTMQSFSMWDIVEGIPDLFEIIGNVAA